MPSAHPPSLSFSFLGNHLFSKVRCPSILLAADRSLKRTEMKTRDPLQCPAPRTPSFPLLLLFFSSSLNCLLSDLFSLAPEAEHSYDGEEVRRGSFLGAAILLFAFPLFFFPLFLPFPDPFLFSLREPLSRRASEVTKPYVI